MKWLCATPEDFPWEEFNRIRNRLSPSRAQRIHGLVREQDQFRSLTGDLLAEKLLAEFGIYDVPIEVAPSGQPQLPGTGLSVSLSHCQNAVVCALSENPVGIDIEKIRPMDLAISRHICTREEAEYLFGHTPTVADLHITDDPLILRRFFEIWTGKESYFKRLGTGITDLRSVNILPLPRQTILKDDYFITILE